MSVINLEDANLRTRTNFTHPAPRLMPIQQRSDSMLDIIIASFVILMVLPVMAGITLMIKLTSSGPVLFKPLRVNNNGKSFRLYRFRSTAVSTDALETSVTETDEHGNVIHKMNFAPRETAIGRFIRRTNLDELPQLFNVIKGDIRFR